VVSVLLKPEEHVVKEEVLFLSREDAKTAVISIGLKVGDDGIIYTKKGDIIKCAVCGEVLMVSNIGTFFPGSVEAICTKFQCFINEMTKIEERLQEGRIR